MQVRTKLFFLYAHYAGSRSNMIVSSSSITVKSQLIKKLNHLISTDREQVIEVEFDYKIEEQAIAKIENLM
jgi:hypothetical protein